MKEDISSRAGDRKIVIKVERERVQFGECYAGVLIVFASESKGRETCDDHLIQICYFTDEMVEAHKIYWLTGQWAAELEIETSALMPNSCHT